MAVTVADLDALLVATAHECKQAERAVDSRRWERAHSELDRLLELRHATSARIDGGLAPVLA